MDNSPKKLYRSRADRKLGGVCGGLGEYLNFDPTIVRILVIAGFFLSGTLVFWIYLAMWLVIPESPIQ